MIGADEFWWDNITGPRQFVTKVLDVLVDNQMVILTVPSDLPWRHTMRGEIESRFRDISNSSEIVIESIDAKDEIGDTEPGTFLLNRYAAFDDEIREGFRETRNNTIQNYIKKNNVLRNRIIWIKGLSVDQSDTWVEFCEKYKINNISDGCFVLEIQGMKEWTNLENVRVISYDECISQHDVQLFNSLYLDENYNYSEYWNLYISTIAANLCETDPEISQKMIDLGSFDKVSPDLIIEKIAKDDEFIRRGSDENSGHILSIVRKNNKKEIRSRIWKAQMQVFFPIIEMERIKLIEKWFDKIQNALVNNHVEQYDIHITDPYDVELGTLFYLNNHYDKQGNYKLHIPDANDRQKIKFLHECRNLLAHMKCCSPDQIKGLLNL